MNTLWRLWHEGQRLPEIAKALNATVTSVTLRVHRAGGVAPRARKRRPNALTERERELISRGLATGHSVRAIARSLERPASTVSREIARNTGRSKYRAVTAERRAWRVARRPKPCKLAACASLRRLVACKLRLEWSPHQIAGWLRVTFPADSTMQVSHETIYRTLFVQARGALKKELQEHLRRARRLRRPRSREKLNTSSIVDGVSIRERPAEVKDRAVPGHWEGDLLFGTPDSYIATLVERKTRFCILVKLESKDAVSVARALAKAIKRLPTELRKTLTWDRGSELSEHKALATAADLAVYFCDPRSPWQRGSNENTNGLLRQYFPKGVSVAHFTQADLNNIAARLNGRPRETLGFRTPAQELKQLLR
jgi:IS30 family transposase